MAGLEGTSSRADPDMPGNLAEVAPDKVDNQVELGLDTLVMGMLQMTMVVAPKALDMGVVAQLFSLQCLWITSFYEIEEYYR